MLVESFSFNNLSLGGQNVNKDYFSKWVKFYTLNSSPCNECMAISVLIYKLLSDINYLMINTFNGYILGLN